MHFRALHLAFLLVLLPFSRAFTELSRRQQSTSSALGLSRTRLSANINSDLAREEPFNRKLAYGSLWGLLVAYVFLAAPGGSPEAAAIDNDLIAKLISTPYDGEVTPLYASLFNVFPVVSFIYAGLLLPGSKDQRGPALLSVLASLALGFFALGPYLGLRDLKYQVEGKSEGWGSLIYNSKLLTLVMVGFSGYLLQYACLGAFEGNRMTALVDLFQSQRFVNVSVIDLSILLLAVIGYIRYLPKLTMT